MSHFRISMLTAALLASVLACAQTGQVWPTQTRQLFRPGENDELEADGEPEAYSTYFLFVSDDAFLHCTETITSLYQIRKRKQDGGTRSYEVVSEAGNEYVYYFDEDASFITIVAASQGFVLGISCAPMYETAVMEQLGQKRKKR
jgi:hypothetical protein